MSIATFLMVVGVFVNQKIGMTMPRIGKHKTVHFSIGLLTSAMIIAFLNWNGDFRNDICVFEQTDQ